jgi:PUL domain
LPASVDIIKRCLEFPSDKLFPCLDLYRIFLLHPYSSEGYSGSDGGSYFLAILLAQLDKSAPKANIMLAVRCLCNLFKNQSSQHAVLKNRQRIIDAVATHLYHEDKNVRQAVITLMLK